MDAGMVIDLGAAALIAALLILAYAVRGRRLRETKRRLREFLAGYFSGDVSLEELAKQAREVASRRFMGGPECQALVQAAFQRAAEAKLAGAAHSLEVERTLLAALAAVRAEFGLPERYRNEGWRPGRE
jgi:hypothetical protein